jgi:hypothetical protein
MICCTEPGLTDALYILYIHILNNMYNVQNINILYIMTTDLLLLTVTLTNDRPVLLSERAPYMDKIVTVKQKLIFGHEPQMGLDTKTDRFTDRESQCHIDFDLTSLLLCSPPTFTLTSEESGDIFFPIVG